MDKSFLISQLNKLECESLEPSHLSNLVEDGLQRVNDFLKEGIDKEAFRLAWKFVAATLLRVCHFPNLSKNVGQKHRLVPFVDRINTYLSDENQHEYCVKDSLLCLLVILKHYPSNVNPTTRNCILPSLVNFVSRNPTQLDQEALELSCQCIAQFCSIGSQKSESWSSFMDCCLKQLWFCVQAFFMQDPHYPTQNEHSLCFPAVVDTANLDFILHRIKTLQLIVDNLINNVALKDAVNFPVKQACELFVHALSPSRVHDTNKMHLPQFYSMLLHLCKCTLTATNSPIVAAASNDVAAQIVHLLSTYYCEWWSYKAVDCLTSLLETHSMTLQLDSIVERIAPLILNTLKVERTEKSQITAHIGSANVSTVDEAVDLLHHESLTNTVTSAHTNLHNSCCRFLTVLISTSGPYLKAGFYADLQRGVCQSCVSNFGRGSEYVWPLDTVQNRVSLYKLLQAFLLNPHPRVPVPIHLATHIFGFGVNDMSSEVRDVCRTATQVTVSIKRPVVPPWGSLIPIDKLQDIAPTMSVINGLHAEAKKTSDVDDALIEDVESGEEQVSDAVPTKEPTHLEVMQSSDEDSDIEILEASLPPASKKKRIEISDNNEVAVENGDTPNCDKPVNTDSSVDVSQMMHDFDEHSD